MNDRIGQTGAGLKPEDITPGSEMANLIGMYISVRHFSCVNLTRHHRAGDGEVQVVAKAAWVLAHATELQPVHRLF